MDYKGLQNFLKKNIPYKNLYYSQSKYLNPRRMEHSLEKTIFLGAYLCLDFDETSIDNIKRAYNLILKKFPNIKLLYLLQTNKSRRFQMVFEDELKDIRIENPKERIEFYNEKRKELCNYLKENNVEFDDTLFNDMHYVIRMPLSKRESGFITTFRTLEELDNLEFSEKIKKTKSIKEKEFISYKALKSTLEGKKDLQLLCFRNPNFSKLLKIQKIYNIGNIYLLKFPSEIIGFTLKLFPKRRCEKIYNTYGTKWKNNFKFIRITKKIDSEGRTVENGFIPLKVLKSNDSGLYSLQHAHFVKDFFEIPYSEKIKYIGNENLKVYELKVEKGGNYE